MKSQARPRIRIGVKATTLTTIVCLQAWLNGSGLDSNASAREGLALHIIVI